ncbi:MAG: cupredoxin domain-containing protein [Chloroflexi bacterium]|nr:cupredoxin domain-containing protein [Chloroflexota bacterium]
MMQANIPRLVLVGAVVLVGLAGLPSTVSAQEATPQGEATARPVHIHAGTCEELGEIVYPLTPLTLPQGESVGNSAVAVAAATSYTPLPASLDQILADQYAVNVHFSDERIEEYIACGEIGGALTEQGALVIALQEQNDSGFAGVAFLSPSAPAPTAASDVSVFLIPLEAQAAGLPTADQDIAATPAVDGGQATPAMGGEEAAGADEAVATPDLSDEDAAAPPVVGGPEGTPVLTNEDATEEAVVAPDVEDGAGFATVDLSNPSRVTVTADEELTVVNTGQVPRSFTIPELGIDQSVAPGQTVSIPLETPGNYRFVVREDGVEVDNRALVVE